MFLIKQRSNDRVQTDRFTLSGSTGHKYVGHFAEVDHKHFICNRFTKCNRQIIRRFLEFLTADNTLSRNDFRIGVRNFDTDRSLPRNRSNNTDPQCRKAESNIILQSAYFGDTHPLFGSNFIKRHCGSYRCLDRADLNTKATQCIDNLILVCILLFHIDGRFIIFIMPHQVNGRKTVILKIEFRIIRLRLLATVVFIIIFSNLYFKVRFFICLFIHRRQRIGSCRFECHRHFLSCRQFMLRIRRNNKFRFPHIRFLYLRLFHLCLFRSRYLLESPVHREFHFMRFWIDKFRFRLLIGKSRFIFFCLFLFSTLKETKSKEFTQPYHRTCTDINQETDGCHEQYQPHSRLSDLRSQPIGDIISMPASQIDK